MKHNKRPDIYCPECPNYKYSYGIRHSCPSRNYLESSPTGEPQEYLEISNSLINIFKKGGINYPELQKDCDKLMTSLKNAITQEISDDKVEYDC